MRLSTCWINFTSPNSIWAFSPAMSKWSTPYSDSDVTLSWRIYGKRQWFTTRRDCTAKMFTSYWIPSLDSRKVIQFVDLSTLSMSNYCFYFHSMMEIIFFFLNPIGLLQPSCLLEMSTSILISWRILLSASSPSHLPHSFLCKAILSWVVARRPQALVSQRLALACLEPLSWPSARSLIGRTRRDYS